MVTLPDRPSRRWSTTPPSRVRLPISSSLSAASTLAVGVGAMPRPGLLEEDQAGLALEGGQVLADGGRGVAEMVGRGLHRTAGHDRPEDPEALDVEHPPLYSNASCSVSNIRLC